MRFDKPVLLVYNPKGGSANPNAVRELDNALAKRTGRPAKIVETQRDAVATRQQISDMRGETSLVVAMGGDGTARVVAEACVGTDTPMAVFPGGTGNLFARTFGNYPTPKIFADILANGSPQPIDLMEAEYTSTGDTAPQKRLVLVGLGIGKLSDAIADADPTWKRWIGSLAYAVGIANASFNAIDHVVRFSDKDGKSLGDDIGTLPVSAAFLLNVAPPHLINISRGCNASDHLLDLVLFQAKNMSQLANAAMWLGIGKPERSRHYARRRLSEVVIRSDQPMKMNIDGDNGGLTHEVTVRAKPGAVHMLLS